MLTSVEFEVISDIQNLRNKVPGFLRSYKGEDVVVGDEILSRLSKKIFNINMKKHKPDILFINGDLCDYADAKGLKQVADILKNSQVPIFKSPGNHDLWNYKEFKGLNFFYEHANPNYSEFGIIRQRPDFHNLMFIKNGICFIIIDNIRRNLICNNPHTACIPEFHQESKDWLKEKLEVAKNHFGAKIAVVMSHAPFAFAWPGANPIVQLKPKGLKVLHIASHLHYFKVKKINNEVTQVITPALFVNKLTPTFTVNSRFGSWGVNYGNQSF